ncbi:hypothetical protein Poly21_54040 [Allorhodopirellula heiligendammensis]|uniref:Uncharacterized protein n=1 Tax=Allorhodopirellula heiligendammensis TaxID=2714739 RepID=A0A5C6BDZ3_9BACT|nr:hypothetical protein Poly21_54040 [Allorhodopirellula heiligendammensis]
MRYRASHDFKPLATRRVWTGASPIRTLPNKLRKIVASPDPLAATTIIFRRNPENHRICPFARLLQWLKVRC